MQVLNRDLMTSVSALKKSPRDVIDQAKKEGSGIYILNRNQPEAVVLSVDDYEALVKEVDRLNDLLDIQLVQERVSHTTADKLLTDEQVRGKEKASADNPIDPDDGWE
ncbi:type II toxin-antitoxin system Phd/YefM family antitoxin [Schleiferilactobacillus shenzhenensis]|uniref:Antitoxin n=1 Tax=Schleiferilactobacillus shenzhenensis LY-73 TaxID=1231336 RepID=U4TJS1_9LACO|nr:type II toxin-antitoxin system Phd/YefM family antitoxin [Schleiferilactobacillus shenzhenensis]ERL64459.1 hypothetical protein L248_0870 [Schleiferilactobacillus shenzhenensis LY-73]